MPVWPVPSSSSLPPSHLAAGQAAHGEVERWVGHLFRQGAHVFEPIGVTDITAQQHSTLQQNTAQHVEIRSGDQPRHWAGERARKMFTYSNERLRKGPMRVAVRKYANNSSMAPVAWYFVVQRGSNNHSTYTIT